MAADSCCRPTTNRLLYLKQLNCIGFNHIEVEVLAWGMQSRTTHYATPRCHTIMLVSLCSTVTSFIKFTCRWWNAHLSSHGRCYTIRSSPEWLLVTWHPHLSSMNNRWRKKEVKNWVGSNVWCWELNDVEHCWMNERLAANDLCIGSGCDKTQIFGTTDIDLCHWYLSYFLSELRCSRSSENTYVVVW